jgi:hypothetical protein
MAASVNPLLRGRTLVELLRFAGFQTVDQVAGSISAQDLFDLRLAGALALLDLLCPTVFRSSTILRRDRGGIDQLLRGARGDE